MDWWQTIFFVKKIIIGSILELHRKINWCRKCQEMVSSVWTISIFLILRYILNICNKLSHYLADAIYSSKYSAKKNKFFNLFVISIRTELLQKWFITNFLTTNHGLMSCVSSRSAKIILKIGEIMKQVHSVTWDIV